MIDNLVQLSRDPSPARRRELLRSIADMFLEDVGAYNDRLLVQFTDVLTILLGQVDTRARTEFAERVSEAPHAGHALHCALANDNLDVATPVLRRSTLLDDETLVDIASRQSQGHLEAIATRDRLSAAVTEALVSYGESSVLRVVTGNFGAEISESSFVALADKAWDDRELLDAMSYRPDMPRKIAGHILELLPEESRMRLAALLAADRDAVRPLFRKAAALTKQKKLGRALERLETKGLMQQAHSGEITLDQVVCLLADKNRILDLALVLAEFANIEESMVTGAILKINAAPTVVLMRNLELGEDAVRAVANLRCRRLNLPNSMREHLIERWNELDVATARRAMHFTLACHAVQTAA